MTNQEVSKKNYHHGDLRTALIHAAFELIEEKGVDAFSLKAASDLVGVSVAAPYRHFGDKESLVHEVLELTKVTFSRQLIAASAEHPVGSEEAIIALGRAYLRFISERQHLGALMFGVHEFQQPHELPNYECEGDPENAYPFTHFREALIAWLSAQQLGPEYLIDLAIPLWTMVHGMAMVKISGAINALSSPELIEGQLKQATQRFLRGFIEDVQGVS